MLYCSRACCTANPFPALESPMQQSKSICCTANGTAAQQSVLLSMNPRCCPANAFAVRELPLLHCTLECTTATGIAALQIVLPCRMKLLPSATTTNPGFQLLGRRDATFPG